MMKTFKILFLSSFVLMTNLAFAQSYVGQISNASTIYNPSFVGSKNDLRIGIGNNYRNYINYYGYDINNNSFLSLDAPIKKISAGIGASITYNTMRDNSSSYFNLIDYSDPAFRQTYSNESNSINLDLTYAQIFTIRNKEKEEIISIRPALTFNGYGWNYTNFDSVNTVINKYNDFSCRLTPSLLITGKKYFVGVKYDSRHFGNINSSYNYSYNNKYFYNNLIYIAGYTFQRKPDSKFSFTPVIQYQFFSNRNYNINRWWNIFQGMTDFNLTFRYGKALLGLNHNGIMLGYQTDKIRICLSGVNVTKGFELSLNYIFNKPKR